MAKKAKMKVVKTAMIKSKMRKPITSLRFQCRYTGSNDQSRSETDAGPLVQNQSNPQSGRSQQVESQSPSRPEPLQPAGPVNSALKDAEHAISLGGDDPTQHTATDTGQGISTMRLDETKSGTTFYAPLE